MVICITGASSGIGEATALRLAREPGAQLVLVARRAERLAALVGRLPCPATQVAVDLTDDDAPARVRAHLEETHGGRLDALVNNAGASWRARFADGGYDNVRRTMAINFDAQVRLTEALLPLVRDAAPSAIVNVSSTSGRVARAGAGAYCASKFALCGWSDALGAEERCNGVNVALVLPGFIATEGFPQKELPQFLVSQPAVVADAIADCILNGRPERYTPRYYWLAAALRIGVPRLVRRFTSSAAGARLVTATRPDGR